MKKTISIVVALVMVLVMSVSSFALMEPIPAPTDAPSDTARWADYYGSVLRQAWIPDGTSYNEVIQYVCLNYQRNEIDRSIFQDALDQGYNKALAFESDDRDVYITDAYNEINVIVGVMNGGELPEGVTLPEGITMPGEGGGEGGGFPDFTFPSFPDFTLPDVTLPDVTLPSDFDPSFTIPDFGGSGEGSFLDTILGALGGLGDILFGGGDDTDDPTTPDDDDDLWGDDAEDPEIPDMGDTSVVAVGAVAAVAVAALVLTRKKSKDDDAE